MTNCPSLCGAAGALALCYNLHRMLLEKPQHSIFLPDLVLSDLLPDHFPAWKQDTELESVRWLCKATRQFFALRKRRGCIVNSENQLLHQNELDDSKKANEWVCGVLKSAEPRPRLFVDLCVPLLHSLAFRGDADALDRFLRRLIDEFDEAVAHVEVPSGLWCASPTWSAACSSTSKCISRATYAVPPSACWRATPSSLAVWCTRARLRWRF